MLHVLDGVAADLAEVGGIMREALATNEPRVAELLDALDDFHGKMLRPALLMLVARTLGTIEPRHRVMSASLEMIHTATLIHDDMIDEGDIRRGRPTPHVQFGNSTAVLLGDFFYTHAFHLVAAQGDPWTVETMTATTNVVCEGELHQMCARRDLALSEDEYNRIIYAKTAALCETACRLGAVAGDASQRDAAAAYGLACGMAFQIVDDCLDLSGDPQKVGKTLATDIERGRLTLPFLRLLQMTDDAAERAALGERLLSVNSENDVAAVRELVINGGGVESAMATAREHVATAVAALDGLPAGEHRDTLVQLAEFIVARDF